MITFIGYKHLSGKSPKTKKDYDFYVGYFVSPFSENNLNGNGSYVLQRNNKSELLLSPEFVGEYSPGTVFKDLTFSLNGTVVGGVLHE